MYQYLINGEKKLKGDVSISGSKNAALPILAASLLACGKTVLYNVPNLQDIQTMLKVLEVLGVHYTFKKNTLRLDTDNVKMYKAPYDLVKTMRASIYVLGPLLSRLGKAIVSLPGGCAIGPRPINLHIEGMERLGAKIKLTDGFINAKVKKLKGSEIIFPLVSVGATVNILMAAVLAEGTTVIKNAAIEPEIEELINFLNKMGAKIEGKNTETLTVKGVNKLKSVKYTVMPDRIEAGTFILTSVITNSPIKIKNIIPDHVNSLLKVLQEMGVNVSLKNNSIEVMKTGKLKPVYLKTIPYPGFPTDLQPLIASLLTRVQGISVINESIFENRFAYVPELIRMGADIEIDDHIIIIRGVAGLTGTKVMASDLRGGAALVLAALSADKETTIDRIYHIDRGYENLEQKLHKLGANIQRIKS